MIQAFKILSCSKWIYSSIKSFVKKEKRWSHKLYRENHENLESGIDRIRKSSAEETIQRVIFQWDVLLPLLFVIEMTPLNHILRKCAAGYKLRKSQKKDQSPNIHRWHQTVWKIWKRIGKSNIHSENIQWRHWDGIWLRNMHHTNNEKQKTTQDRRNGTAKSRKN